LAPSAKIFPLGQTSSYATAFRPFFCFALFTLDFYFRSVVAAHDTRSAPSVTSVAKLETEINSLRRQLNQAKRDRAAAPSRSDTLRCIMVGHFRLELMFLYKGLRRMDSTVT